MPFSYYYLSFTSDSPHAIKVYCDISAGRHLVIKRIYLLNWNLLEWMGGDNNLQSNWSVTDDDFVVFLQTQLTTPIPFREVNDRPMDGIAYQAMLHVRFMFSDQKRSLSDAGQRDGISWQIEDCGTMRGAFANGLPLNNTVDPNFHPVGKYVFLSI